MHIGLTTRLEGPFATVVERVRAALMDQGFGVLTEIDVRATLREKLGEEIEDYLILGACNPPLAHRALAVDRQVGLLLPCNVVIRGEPDGHTIVEALDPQLLVDATGEHRLASVAAEAKERLRIALAALTRH